jgi:6-phosphogluconolactonase
MRQADPHSHALVLDPYEGVISYVPDLGKDLIREFYFNTVTGEMMELNVMPSGLCTGMPDGPRYFEFHPQFNVAYVVNELSSTVAVFEVDTALVHEIAQASRQGQNMEKYKGRSTLRLIQSINTIPTAFPTTMNTCGRICVHKSGRFVVVSNRGHQSIAIFRVRMSSKPSTMGGGRRGELCAVGFFHTRGETPRHFQFDNSGQYLIVANQDTDSLAVFSFNLSSGVIKYTGNEYRVPSPNFVCVCPINLDYDESDVQNQQSVSSGLVQHDVPLGLPVGTNTIIHHPFPTVEQGTGSEERNDEIPFPLQVVVDHNDETGRNEDNEELLAAKREIAELKRQLAVLTVMTSSIGSSDMKESALASAVAE